jgi:dTMP kinase
MFQNKKGLFISFEGADGTGKTTQIKLLSKRLSDSGRKVHVTREPGGSELAENIRHTLKANPQLDSITELLLIFAARRSHFVETITPLLNEGYIIISDRFYDSSLIYQGILKNLPIKQIMSLKQMVMNDFEPDMTFILDMSAEAAIARVQSRKLASGDAYDEMSVESYEKVRQGFLHLAKIFDNRSYVINAEGSANTISSKILKIIKRTFALL